MLHCNSTLQNRCVNMIAHLFHAPVGDDETAVGVGTVGSSEAIMLAGLAFKRKWQNKRKAEGKPYDKPNIVTGANVQVSFFYFSTTPLVHHFSTKTSLHLVQKLGVIFQH